MNVKDLKEWLETIPEEFDEFDLAFRDIINTSVTDTAITGIGGDDENEEIYFCDTETYNILIRE